MSYNNIVSVYQVNSAPAICRIFFQWIPLSVIAMYPCHIHSMLRCLSKELLHLATYLFMLAIQYLTLVMLCTSHPIYHGRFHSKAASKCSHIFNNNTNHYQYIYAVTYRRMNISNQNLLSHAGISKDASRKPDLYESDHS